MQFLRVVFFILSAAIKNIHLRCHFGLSNFQKWKIRSWVVCFSFYAVIICVFDVILFAGILSRYFKASNVSVGALPRTTLRAFRAGYACSGNSQLMPNGPYWQFLDYTLLCYHEKWIMNTQLLCAVNGNIYKTPHYICFLYLNNKQNMLVSKT